jgi:hypothetical protein
VTTRTEQPPLDDDPCWLPIDAAHDRWVEQTGDAGLALVDLTDALADARLRCMVRSTSGKRKRRVAATAWHHRLILSAMDGFRVLQRHADTTETVQGWRFFVWEPDLKTMRSARVRS